VVDAVAATGRKKLVIAGLWTEICVAMPAIQALDDDYAVYVVIDASGGVSAEAHRRRVRLGDAAARNPRPHHGHPRMTDSVSDPPGPDPS
jgi:nicotinamidase-related amidase